MKVGPLAAAIVIAVVGVLLAADVGHIGAKWDAANREWRSRGTVRRRVLPYRGTVRYLGVALVVVAALIVVALFFDRS
jgi:uncharacterized membrane protein YidH (DUF202 family)